MSNERDRILILGIGSPFGADCAGWDAIELLRQEPALAGIRLEISDRPGVGLLALVEDIDTAILIDAMLSESQPGSLHLVDPSLLAPGNRTSNHGFGVADALALGQALGRLPRSLHVVGISVDGLIPPVLDAADLLALVTRLLRETAP